MSEEPRPARRNPLRVVGVFINYLLARLVPGAGVGRLISALGSRDEDASVAAYMALVKLGPKNAGRLIEAARQGRCSAALLQVVGDLGDPSVVPDLKEFVAAEDPEVAAAARESIEILTGAGPDAAQEE